MFLICTSGMANLFVLCFRLLIPCPAKFTQFFLPLIPSISDVQGNQGPFFQVPIHGEDPTYGVIYWKGRTTDTSVHLHIWA